MNTQIIKNLLTRLLLIALSVSFLNLSAASIHTAHAEFLDIDQNTRNSEAILYLQQNNVVKGYDDGTFRPAAAVNRAEFLKIIIEGSFIPLDSGEEVPFPDIDLSQWYVPYVQKAYAEGWINGYPDGTFKPEQTINKVESLKILGKAQTWNTDSINSEEYSGLFEDIDPSQWYAPYIAYAKQHQYLEETEALFSPSALMSRGSISEVIYRTLTVENTKVADLKSEKVSTPASEKELAANLEEKSEPKTDSTNIKTETPADPKPPTPAVTEPETNLSPVSFNTIATNAYTGIELSETIPNTFYKNEIYILRGNVTLGTPKKATAILNGEDKTNHKAFMGTVNDNHFEIPMYFDQTGNYYLGLIPNESGESKAYKISVLNNLPASTNTAASLPDPAEGLNISYANDQTTVSFNTGSNILKKVTFSQSNNSVSYYYRQNTNSFPVQYGDFAEFGSGQVTYSMDIAYLKSLKPLEITSAFAGGANKTFTATEHSFDDIDKEEISATVTDTMPSASTISISGTLKTDMKNKALVIKPDGFMDEVTLWSNGGTETYFGLTIIKSGSNFSFNYSPKNSGRYIVEINNKNSEPSLNHPIYIGEIIPLIPDFFDLNQRELYKKTLDLNQERQNLLNLINQSRAAHGLKPVDLVEALNNLAQAHSDDMKNFNYFSHYNLQNQTPDDRRLAMGIKTGVGENIAKDVTVNFAHNGFMRSASHRQNILNPEWTRLGLGITLSEGHLIIAEEFSTEEVTGNELTIYKNELLNSINNKRSNNNIAALILNSPLDNAGKTLNDKAVNEGAALTNSDFTNALQSNGIQGSSQLIGRTGNPWKNLLDSLINEETAFFESAWKLIGIDIQTDKTGKIHTIVIINDND